MLHCHKKSVLCGKFWRKFSVSAHCAVSAEKIAKSHNETQHFRMASVELEATSNAKNLKTRFNTASEVTSFLTRFMGCIQRSRSALVNPKKRTLEELRNSKNVVCFTDLHNYSSFTHLYSNICFILNIKTNQVDI